MAQCLGWRSAPSPVVRSIAGAASYMLLVRVPTPRDLETLLREIRMAANVNTRTTIVLQTFFENRPLAL